MIKEEEDDDIGKSGLCHMVSVDTLGTSSRGSRDSLQVHSPGADHSSELPGPVHRLRGAQ